MGYIKKAYRKILEEMDYMDYLPPKWSEFVSVQEKKHNLFIKKGNECVCTNCKHIFKINKKVNESGKCPNCKISKKFNSSIVEYARIMPDEYDATFVNDRVSKCQCYIHVNHRQNARKMEIIYKTL